MPGENVQTTMERGQKLEDFISGKKKVKGTGAVHWETLGIYPQSSPISLEL